MMKCKKSLFIFFVFIAIGHSRAAATINWFTINPLYTNLSLFNNGSSFTKMRNGNINLKTSINIYGVSLSKQIQLECPYVSPNREISGLNETYYAGDYMIFSVNTDQNDVMYEWYFDLIKVEEYTNNATVAVSTQQTGPHPLKLVITNSCGEQQILEYWITVY